MTIILYYYIFALAVCAAVRAFVMRNTHNNRGGGRGNAMAVMILVVVDSTRR